MHRHVWYKLIWQGNHRDGSLGHNNTNGQLAQLRHNHQGTGHQKMALHAKWLKVLPFNYNHY